MWKIILLIVVFSIVVACKGGSGGAGGQGDSSSDKIEGSVVDVILAQLIPVAYAAPAAVEPTGGLFSYKSIISESNIGGGNLLHQSATLRDATYSESYAAYKDVITAIKADIGLNATFSVEETSLTFYDPLTSAPENGFIVLQYISTDGVACAIQFAALHKVGASRTFSVTTPSSVPANCRSIVLMESIFPGEGNRTSVRRALKLTNSPVAMSPYSTAILAAAKAPIRDMLVAREAIPLAFDALELATTYQSAKDVVDAQLVVRGLTSQTFNQKISSIVNVLAMDPGDSSIRSGWSSVVAASYVLLDNATTVGDLDTLEAAVVAEFSSCLGVSTPTWVDWTAATCNVAAYNAFYAVYDAANPTSHHQQLQLDI